MDHAASTKVADVPMPNASPAAQWTIKDVFEWAKTKVSETHATKLQDQEIDGDALLKMNAQAFERCGIPVGPALKLEEAVVKLRPAQPAQVAREPSGLISLTNYSSKVVGFNSDALSPKNFICHRSATVQTIISWQEHTILFASPVFTGKTSLFQLVHEKLNEMGLPHITIRLTGFNPSVQTLGACFKDKCGYDIEDLNRLVAKQGAGTPLYVLIDEFQLLHPETEAHLRLAYPFLDESRYHAVLSSFLSFHGYMKSWKTQNVRFLCFSSYGGKFGTILNTPYTFDRKTSKFAFFSTDELAELYSDFKKRTVHPYFAEHGLSPKVQTLLFQMTSGHVGFTSCMLHFLNEQAGDSLNAEDSVLSFLVSTTMFNHLFSQRTLPSLDALNNDEQAAFVRLWEQKTIPKTIDNTVLYRRGFVLLPDDDENSLQLPCNLSYELLLMTLYPLSRPVNDPFENLGQFMEAALKKLPRTLFQSTSNFSFGSSTNHEILESLWQAEFYRIAHSILAKSSFLSTTVKRGTLRDGSEFVIDGLVDFFINGTRKWGVEFLTLGSHANTDKKLKGTRADSHAQRFNPDGKYGLLPCNDYLIVDFRPYSKRSGQDFRVYHGEGKDAYSTPKESFKKNYWIVVYEDRPGEPLELTVTKYGSDTKLLGEVKIIPLN